ncbi:probable ATP-dependent RNA helicase DDX27 [Limulus polyphemus]|uniref:RNA helicase n=1 Tax=Limulus polyphemus TaxID=6850 RepID=A0ABM1BDN1_LIMPO|nr:probable ATP-dependent RNA helicase DDX27 [Limulus polyphemus]
MVSVLHHEPGLGLMRTIQEDEDISLESESSDENDSEPELNCVKQKRHIANLDFNDSFKFINSATDYYQDTWEDLTHSCKKKSKSQNEEKNVQLQESVKVKGRNNEQKNEVMTKDVLKTKFDKHKHQKINESKEVRVEYKSEKDCIEVFPEGLIYDKSLTFQQMNLSRPLQKAITAMNFLYPTPVQAATIPVALMGRDICGCAATGTGKTAAFMLPVLERLLYKPKQQPVTRVLVLVPTRELGVQVYKVSRQLSQFTNIEIALSVGGLDLAAQEHALRKTPDIVIATPGRLIDHIHNTPSFGLCNIEILILDEADRMLDEYFAEQMKEIIRDCAHTRQTMLFSATLSEMVQDLAVVSLKDPVKIFINSNTEVAFNLRQEFIRIRENREGDREPILAALVSRTFHERVLIFVQTKKQVHRLRVMLELMEIKVDELHGNLNQIHRLEALRRFQEEEVDVLIATDVAARGLDIPGVCTIINFTMPNTLQHYIHRVGRTARAGHSGRSVSMVGESERKLLKEIIKKARNPVKHRIVPQVVVSHYHDRIASLENNIEQILKTEKVEKEINLSDQKIKKVEEMIGKSSEVHKHKRNWYQTVKEKKRHEAEKRLSDFKGKKKKQGGKINNTAEGRVIHELEKVAQYQARSIKRSRKPQRIKTIDERDKKTRIKRKNSQKRSFAEDLGNVNKKSVKSLRSIASDHRKLERRIGNKRQPGKKFKSKSKFKRKK